MGRTRDSTPGRVGRVQCRACGALIFFTVAGGPDRLHCTHCRAEMSIEVVHNGRRWKIKSRTGH